MVDAEYWRQVEELKRLDREKEERLRKEQFEMCDAYRNVKRIIKNEEDQLYAGMDKFNLNPEVRLLMCNLFTSCLEKISEGYCDQMKTYNDMRERSIKWFGIMELVSKIGSRG